MDGVTMGEKYRMTSSFLDGFQVSFSRKYPCRAELSLWTFCNRVLGVGYNVLRELERLFPLFRNEFTIFLSARDPSSATTAQQALNALWDVLIQLPVYQHLGRHGNSIRWLLRDMKESPELVDEMLTPGTGRSDMLQEWLNRLENIFPSIEEFIRNTRWMLEEYFKDLPYRKPEDYAFAFGRYQHDVAGEYQKVLEERANNNPVPEPDLPQMSFPVNVSFSPAPAPDGSKNIS